MTVKPAEYNGFTIFQGATFDDYITVSDNAKNPVNLTGYNVRMQIRDQYDGKVILDLTTANNRISIVPTQGKIMIKISHTDTGNLAPGVYVYDIELFNNTRVDRYLQGTITVSAGVTK